MGGVERGLRVAWHQFRIGMFAVMLLLLPSGKWQGQAEHTESALATGNSLCFHMPQAAAVEVATLLTGTDAMYRYLDRLVKSYITNQKSNLV